MHFGYFFVLPPVYTYRFLNNNETTVWERPSWCYGLQGVHVTATNIVVSQFFFLSRRGKIQAARRHRFSLLFSPGWFIPRIISRSSRTQFLGTLCVLSPTAPLPLPGIPIQATVRGQWLASSP